MGKAPSAASTTPLLPPRIAQIVLTLVEHAEEIETRTRIVQMVLALIEHAAEIEALPSGEVTFHFSPFHVDLRPPTHSYRYKLDRR